MLDSLVLFIMVFSNYLICYLEDFVVVMIDVVMIVDLLVMIWSFFWILYMLFDWGFNFLFSLVKEVIYLMNMKKVFEMLYYL